MTTVRSSRPLPQRAPSSTRQSHADQALGLAKQFPRVGFHYSAADASSLPKEAGQIVEVLLKFGNGARDRAGRLGLEGGFAHSEPKLSPAQTLDALAAIEKRAGKKASTVLTEAAASKEVTPGARDVLQAVSALVRGGLEKQPGFRSAEKLYAAKLPTGGPSLKEQQDALDKAMAREAAERGQRAWNSPGVDWNWSRGNRPSQAPQSLFVRK